MRAETNAGRPFAAQAPSLTPVFEPRRPVVLPPIRSAASSVAAPAILLPTAGPATLTPTGNQTGAHSHSKLQPAITGDSCDPAKSHDASLSFNFCFKDKCHDALPSFNCFNDKVYSEFSSGCSYGNIRGRLHKRISFRHEIGASQFVINVISNGYYLPFISQPHPFLAKNHRSSIKNAYFVSSAIRDLLDSGSVLPVDEQSVLVCSRLDVVVGKKFRLILDLRELNKHIKTVRFRYGDIETACNLFDTDEFFFAFDLKSAYHHIDIDPSYYKYLGFEWKGQHYVFASLPFGLCSAPYVFTKVC